MSKPSNDLDSDDSATRIELLFGAGRRSESAFARELATYGSLDLPTYAKDFKCSWRLRLRYHFELGRAGPGTRTGERNTQLLAQLPRLTERAGSESRMA